MRADYNMFPNLRGTRITHRWGCPFSVTLDLTPALGYLGDEWVVYSVGRIGHGVSLPHLNGQTIRDLILEEKTELTRALFCKPTSDALAARAASVRGECGAEGVFAARGLEL